MRPSVRDAVRDRILNSDRWWSSEQKQGRPTDTFWDTVSVSLSAAGMVPGIGIIPDALSVVVDAVRGDWAGVGLDLMSMIPAVGLFSGSIKVVKGVDTIADTARTIDKAADIADFAKDAAKAAGKVDDVADAGKAGKVEITPNVSYERPSGYRKGIRDQVWENAKNKNGDVFDPVTQKAMDPNEPWDMGHKPGYEFKKHQQSAKERGISRKQFLDEHNDPAHYRPELPSSNRSHAGEDVTNNYFGHRGGRDE